MDGHHQRVLQSSLKPIPVSGASPIPEKTALQINTTPILSPNGCKKQTNQENWKLPLLPRNQNRLQQPVWLRDGSSEHSGLLKRSQKQPVAGMHPETDRLDKDGAFVGVLPNSMGFVSQIVSVWPNCPFFPLIDALSGAGHFKMLLMRRWHLWVIHSIRISGRDRYRCFPEQPSSR